MPSNKHDAGDYDSKSTPLAATDGGGGDGAADGRQQPLQQQQGALSDLDVSMNKTRPKHVVDGVTSGVGYIVAGAVGAAGIVMLAPAVGAKEGSKAAGVTGAAVGAVAGTVVGVGSAVSVAAGGILAGVGQMLRGVVNTPAAVIQPARGFWWNPNDGRWVKTHLGTEAEWIATQPEYDEDILGDTAVPEEIRNERQASAAAAAATGPLKTDPAAAAAAHYGVHDMDLYDLLGVTPDTDAAAVQRRYYQICRKFAPTRAGGGSHEAEEKLAQIGRAYVILTNPELRAKYDRYGVSGVYSDSDSEQQDQDNVAATTTTTTIQTMSLSAVDPMELYTCMFASRDFEPYIGRLAAASNAVVGEEVSSKITLTAARLLQRRRVTRLALLLADRLKPWTHEGRQAACRAQWQADAEQLSKQPFGLQLTHLIGNVYAACGAHFLGSLESGVGMPSVHKWSQKQQLEWKYDTQHAVKKMEKFALGDRQRRNLEQQAASSLSSAKSEQDQRDSAKRLYETMGAEVMEMLWMQTVLDVTNTIYEVVQMVCYDRDLNNETRKLRGEGIEVLGGIFTAVDLQKELDTAYFDRQKQEDKYREIAFYAVLDTVTRQDGAARQQQQAANDNNNNNSGGDPGSGEALFSVSESPR